jgi:hypothetical protein
VEERSDELDRSLGTSELGDPGPSDELNRLVHDYESAGLSVQEAKAWLDAGLDPWDPQTAGELQAAGISPKIAFRPIKNQAMETDLTIYRMVSSGQ